MRILLAVIDDLWEFARSAIFGVLTTKIDGGYFRYHESPQEKTLQLFEQQTSQTEDTQLSEKRYTKSEIPLLQGSQYFVGVHNALIYTDPIVAFDTAFEKLSYGDIVFVSKLGDTWAYVRSGLHEGWIRNEVLKEQARDVFPSFVFGTIYDAQNEETRKLRSYIEDMFLGEATGLLLTDSEYVTYMLSKKGKHISWSEERPRIAGTWQKKLRGRSGIYMGISPKTESVMEYIHNDEGHLCYVEAVFPDESIKLSSIGLFSEGVYEDSMMQKDEWKELRPVFIEVM